MFKKVSIYFEDGNVKNFRCDSLCFSNKSLVLSNHTEGGEDLIERNGMKKVLITFYSDLEIIGAEMGEKVNGRKP